MSIKTALELMPYWDEGHNHMIFEFSDAPCLPFEVNKAIIATVIFLSHKLQVVTLFLNQPAGRRFRVLSSSGARYIDAVVRHGYFHARTGLAFFLGYLTSHSNQFA
jgi:hypothetical protein